MLYAFISDFYSASSGSKLISIIGIIMPEIIWVTTRIALNCFVCISRNSNDSWAYVTFSSIFINCAGLVTNLYFSRGVSHIFFPFLFHFVFILYQIFSNISNFGGSDQIRTDNLHFIRMLHHQLCY